MNMTDKKFTGRRRHRIETRGWLNPKTVMILQYELEGLVSFWAGTVEVEQRTKWVDAKPEWITMEELE